MNLLDILTKFSPSSLAEIDIHGYYWEYSFNALENFFKSCRERTLLEFGFIDSCARGNITKKHEAIVENYVREGVIQSLYCIYDDF